MRRVKIGPRLAFSFALILLLMFLTAAVSLWQLNTIQAQTQRLHRADMQVAAVLRVHNNVLSLKGELQRLALARGEANHFTETAAQLRDGFIQNVDNAIITLGPLPRHAQQIEQLESIKILVPAQVDTMIDLAQANDWVSVQLRLVDELEEVSQTTEMLVEEIDAEVSVEQQMALALMEQAQQQALLTIVIASLLALLAAGALAFIVIRSIAQPLARLDTGAKALAQGEFHHHIPVTGDDELSHLSQVFNDTAAQLAGLYATLENRVRERTEELNYRYRQLETSIAVGHHITSTLDLDTLLHRVTERIKALYGYDYVGVFLLDESGDYVTAQAGTGEAGQTLRQTGFRLLVSDDSMIGWVAKNRRLARIDDVSQDQRYVPLAGVSETRSELALPLAMGRKMLGVLDIRSHQIAAFRLDDLPVLQSLADQVAIAIQNAFLYQSERARRHLAETLYEVGHALSRTLDLAEVLNLILEHLDKTVPYNRAAVMLQNKGELEVVAARGFLANVQPLQLRIAIKDDDVFQQIYHTRQPLVIPDVTQRPDWQHLEYLPQARAWLGVPLTRFDQVIGMLSLVREEPDAFSGDEVKLAATFAGQAAFALENARLYDKIIRFTQQLEDMVRERTIAVQEAYDQLERLDRTKSDFIRIAAHELRTPLTVLRGYSRMLLNDPQIKKNPHRLELITGIHTGAVRLQEIVTSMLDIAKIDGRVLELYPEPLAIASVIELVAQSFKEALTERKQTLTIGDMSDLPSVMADPDAMHKVFYHLIVNAIKYTPDSGKIIITGHCLNGGSDDPISGLEIVVSDTGIGIDPRFHELIFTKFYQTGELAFHSTGRTTFKGAGPGLGLAIAKGIVEAHHGKIWVESSGYDEKTCPGSQFHVVLPLRQKTEPTPKNWHNLPKILQSS
jgi:signal transduction histidine kinase